MLGTIVNVVAVVVGSAIGLLVRSRLPQKMVEIVFQAFGLFTIFLGTKMALGGDKIIVLVFSLALGGLLGQAFRLDERIDGMGDRLRRLFHSNNDKFTQGMTTAFLLYCVGAMTILGAIEEGLGNPPTLLLTKSLMDGISSVALAAALGIGVMFSALPLLIFQGGITLLAMWLGEFFPQYMIVELSSLGGILLIGLGFNVLEIKEVKVLNMLPSLLVVLPLAWLAEHFGGAFG